MGKYSLGLDFGTNSCRCLVVDVSEGREIASSVFEYPSGVQGIITDATDPNLARQNPQDYIDGIKSVVRSAMAATRLVDDGFRSEDVIGIGEDTTGSTPIPVDVDGEALALCDEFAGNPNAMAWLWKDHTSTAEAAEITKLAAEMHPEYLDKCGGTYSSEWFWAKVLRLKRVAPDVFDVAASFVECSDWIPALLTGNRDPLLLKRSVCTAGHKGFYCDEWGGWPSEEFLAELDSGLVKVRDSLAGPVQTADKSAGTLCDEWAGLLGLPAEVVVAVGAMDAHMGAVGAGCSEGTLVKILGTSTCDLMVGRSGDESIPGICGIVKGSVLPDYFGIEAGQSAVGDLFLWFVNNHVPESYGSSVGDKFSNLEKRAAEQRPGESGLLALDWNNGNRCVLVDQLLSGLMLGQSLHTEAHEIYRALIEATAFGALTIVRRVEQFGVPVNEIICCGGLAEKNALLMQIYADVLGKPMKVSASNQTCALGAAMFGAVVAGKDVGGYSDVDEAQQALCRVRDVVYEPIAKNVAVYKELYTLYESLHDGFGIKDNSVSLGLVMKELLGIRRRER